MSFLKKLFKRSEEDPRVDVKRDGNKVEVSAFVSDDPSRGISQDEAAEILAESQAALDDTKSDDGAKINAAARLMMAGQYEACIKAYLKIAQEHPERRGTCEGQIGAAYYFLGQYETAIEHYELAKQHGEEDWMMDENIAEAKEAIAGRA